ncbi:MAG: YdeI/OmpD-associated family protein [Bdellovibrionales bacterium]
MKTNALTNVENAKFFKSATDFRKWLQKNHAKQRDVWLRLNKKSSGSGGLTMQQAAEQALCFGWTYANMKGLDQWSYLMRFMRRKPGGIWSYNTVKHAKKLHTKGLLHKAGLEALNKRNKKRSMKKEIIFSSAQLKQFKADKKAWAFFKGQTPSYQKYTTWWVTSAVRPETQKKRLHELIRDSAEGTKLKRILAAMEKTKKVYEPGFTPIEEARNIGPVVGAELRSIGIDTVEKLQAKGWEETFHQLCEVHPHRINANMVTGLIGAVENQDWRKVDAGMKAEGLALVREMKRSWTR